MFGLWTYSFLLVLPTILELHGKFGYDKDLGKCGYLKREMDETPDPRSLYFSIGFLNPLIIMLVSYYRIWRKTISSSSFLKLMWFVIWYGEEESSEMNQIVFNRDGFSIPQTRRQLHSRDLKTTWALCLLCFCYIIFVGPIVLATLAGVHGQINLFCFILYWFQVRGTCLWPPALGFRNFSIQRTSWFTLPRVNNTDEPTVCISEPVCRGYFPWREILRSLWSICHIKTTEPPTPVEMSYLNPTVWREKFE